MYKYTEFEFDQHSATSATPFFIEKHISNMTHKHCNRNTSTMSLDKLCLRHRVPIERIHLKSIFMLVYAFSYIKYVIYY